MAKLTLSDLVNLNNPASAVSTINNNNSAIETALENTLSRDGTSPNAMGADLDLNGHRILNLPQPATTTEPVRVADLTAMGFGQRFVISVGRAVNFNSVGDTAITIPTIPGFSRYSFQSVIISHSSGTLTNSAFGVYNNAGGTGIAFVSPTSCTIDNGYDNNYNNIQIVTPVFDKTATFNFTTMYFRVTKPQGVAATADVSLQMVFVS